MSRRKSGMDWIDEGAASQVGGFLGTPIGSTRTAVTHSKGFAAREWWEGRQRDNYVGPVGRMEHVRDFQFPSRNPL